MHKIEIPSIRFDSPEENEFNEWCREAKDCGIVESYTYHPPAFKLSDKVEYDKTVKLKTKTKTVKAFLMHPHEYTADFYIVLSSDGMMFLKESGIEALLSRQMYIDVKGGFSRFHDAKSFSINQKWVYAKYGIYVRKVVPEAWFAKTWVPVYARTSPKKGKLRTKYANMRTLENLIETKKIKVPLD